MAVVLVFSDVVVVCAAVETAGEGGAEHKPVSADSPLSGTVRRAEEDGEEGVEGEGAHFDAVNDDFVDFSVFEFGDGGSLTVIAGLIGYVIAMTSA